MSEELETLNRIDRIQKSFEELTNSAIRLNEIVKEKQEEIERLNKNIESLEQENSFLKQAIKIHLES